MVQTHNNIEDLRDMMGWFGEHLDRWLARHLDCSPCQQPKEWGFIAGYNLLEILRGLDWQSTTVGESQSWRLDLKRGIGQAILCLYTLAKTLGFGPSEVLRAGLEDWQSSLEDREGRSSKVMHQLRVALNRHVNQYGSHGGNYRK